MYFICIYPTVDVPPSDYSLLEALRVLEARDIPGSGGKVLRVSGDPEVLNSECAAVYALKVNNEWVLSTRRFILWNDACWNWTKVC